MITEEQLTTLVAMEEILTPSNSVKTKSRPNKKMQRDTDNNNQGRLRRLYVS